MLAALFIALIGVVSHMFTHTSFQGNTSPLLILRTAKKIACVSARALSLPCTVDPAPLLSRAQNAVLPLVFCLSPWYINTLRVREDVCVITPTHISFTMFPSSACRSPRIPGAWPGIDATGAGRSPRVSSRPYSALSQIGNDARSLPRPASRPPPQVSVIPLPPPLHEAHAVVSTLPS